MTEIHLFGSIESMPADMTIEGLGFIHTPITADGLHAYFHETELKGLNVAIVCQEEDERDAGYVFDFMENLDAEVYPFDDSAKALSCFRSARPDVIMVSATLPNLHDFLKAYREMEK
jgi:hypothetical protein